MAKVLGPPPVRLCKALGCRKPVHENDRCLLHWHRQIEREEYAAREAELAATVKLAEGDKTIRHCTVRSCDRPSHAGGLCLAHYERFRRHQSLTHLFPTGDSRRHHREQLCQPEDQK